jgi:phosphoribosyl-ATP pyrophosphohydrolase
MKISFNPFDMDSLDDKARKVCEEATEFYAEHHECLENGTIGVTIGLFNEIGDVLTATLNYCNAAGIDPQQCIDLAEEKNRNRGRYGNGH